MHPRCDKLTPVGKMPSTLGTGNSDLAFASERSFNSQGWPGS